jgi:RimJ/RimL family protein N-acetyltransferase
MPGNERSAHIARKAGMRFERDYVDEYELCQIYAMSLGVPVEG